MYQKILVPVDGSATSDLGLQEATKLAKLTGARLRLLHVVDMLSLAIAGEGAATGDVFSALRDSGQTILRRAEAAVQAADVPVDTVLQDNTTGPIAEVVADQAASWGADLIVLGTHGRRGAARLLIGSDAEQVVRLAPAPVLLVRDKTASPR